MVAWFKLIFFNYTEGKESTQSHTLSHVQNLDQNSGLLIPTQVHLGTGFD